jgi:heme exporter protein B
MAVHHAVHGQAAGAELALLGAMLAVALIACPLLAAVGLRAAVEG